MNVLSLPEHFCQEAWQRLPAGLPPCERVKAKRELGEMFKVSPSTLSRWLHTMRIVNHRRNDRGALRKLGHDQMKAVFEIQYSSAKKTRGPIMPAATAIEIAERNGVIPAGTLTPETFNRWLRINGIARAKIDLPEPHIELASAGPNHVHQADWSLAVNWKIKNNRAVWEEYAYKNKPLTAGEPRLWRLLVIDHCSGAFFPWYMASPGENVTGLIEGLFLAWTGKSCKGVSVQDLYPFRGVPRILMLDRGPGAKSGVLASFLDRFDVKLNICEGARSKGVVESAHAWWERRFESTFRLDPVVSIDRLNDEAVALAARICKTDVHSRHRHTRTAHWEWYINRCAKSVLRVPNCGLAEAQKLAVTASQTRAVSGDGKISFDKNEYRVPAELIGQRQVSVCYSPFEFPNIYVKSAEELALILGRAPLKAEHSVHTRSGRVGTKRISWAQGIVIQIDEFRQYKRRGIAAGKKEAV